MSSESTQGGRSEAGMRVLDLFENQEGADMGMVWQARSKLGKENR